MATNSSIGSNLVRYHGIGMLSVTLHEVLFNTGLTTQFWALTNDIVMNFHICDDRVSTTILIAKYSLTGTLIY